MGVVEGPRRGPGHGALPRARGPSTATSARFTNGQCNMRFRAHLRVLRVWLASQHSSVSSASRCPTSTRPPSSSVRPTSPTACPDVSRRAGPRHDASRSRRRSPPGMARAGTVYRPRGSRARCCSRRASTWTASTRPGWSGWPKISPPPATAWSPWLPRPAPVPHHAGEHRRARGRGAVDRHAPGAGAGRSRSAWSASAFPAGCRSSPPGGRRCGIPSPSSCPSAATAT